MIALRFVVAACVLLSAVDCRTVFVVDDVAVVALCVLFFVSLFVSVLLAVVLRIARALARVCACVSLAFYGVAVLVVIG